MTRRKSTCTESPSMKEALMSDNADEWNAVIQEELTSLEDMKTWEKVDRRHVPRDARILPSKFVLKVNRHENGDIERYKARLVICGNMQQAGVGYDSTFAPVVDFTTIRMMLAISAKKGYKVHHLDVKTAFLTVMWTKPCS